MKRFNSIAAAGVAAVLTVMTIVFTSGCGGSYGGNHSGSIMYNPTPMPSRR